jgi:hypothetical protein
MHSTRNIAVRPIMEDRGPTATNLDRSGNDVLPDARELLPSGTVHHRTAYRHVSLRKSRLHIASSAISRARRFERAPAAALSDSVDYRATKSRQ